MSCLTGNSTFNSIKDYLALAFIIAFTIINTTFNSIKDYPNLKAEYSIFHVCELSIPSRIIEYGVTGPARAIYHFQFHQGLSITILKE